MKTYGVQRKAAELGSSKCGGINRSRIAIRALQRLANSEATISRHS
jgi:hypothetical protein